MTKDPKKQQAGFEAYKKSAKFLQAERERSTREARAKFDARKVTCLWCGASITYEQRKNKFCTHSCASFHNNKQRYPDRKTCDCGKEFMHGEYCSMACRKKYKYNNFISAWKAGTAKLPKGCHVSDHIKRFLIEKCGEVCWECGWHERNPTTGRIPIEVEHIDGDATNHVEENLKLLCPNCHSLTPTYRSLNRGKSKRTWRRKGHSFKD